LSRALHGDVEQGYGPVGDAFLRHFKEKREVGAATAAYVEGRKVVDLWAGLADRESQRAWAKDTAQLVFSASKGVLTICALQLVERGALDLDAPVGRYWPEFATLGKEEIRVRWLLSHRAGLAVLDARPLMSDIVSWPTMVSLLEHQRPQWRPNSGYAYHAMTFGWLVGELVHRASGLLPGDYLRTFIAEPLGLEMWFGIPTELLPRLARVEVAPDDWTDAQTRAQLFEAAIADDRAVRAVTLNGALLLPITGVSRALDWNRVDVQQAQIPAGNLISTARSLSKLYAATIGEVNGKRALSPETVADAVLEQSAGQPVFGLAPDDLGPRWGTGFQLYSPPTRPMLGPHSFGHYGAGGQLGFADTEAKVGFGYVTNLLNGTVDDRANHVVDALRRCLG
jgi:CubicO group peptidase (beta-lactamase class C family)